MSDTLCLLEWNIHGDTADVTGFTVTREVVHGSTPTVSISLPATARTYRLTDLRPSTEYTVCITVTSSEPKAVEAYVCTSVWTNAAPEQPEGDEYERLLTIILVSIFGGTILIVLVVVIIVLVRRYRARRPRKAPTNLSGFASARRKTTRPQIGLGSKRFTKVRDGTAPRRVVSTVSGDDPLGQTVKAAFTPEERATVFAMLAATRDSGIFAASPRAYINAAYDPGSSEFEWNENVYDAISDEQFLDVPLDTAV